MRKLLFVLACAAPVTAAPAPGLHGPIERAVLLEINRARERPAEVARDLRRYRKTLRGLIAYAPGQDRGIATVEGAAAVDEAIAYLERRPAMRALSPSFLLSRAAHVLMTEQARSGAVGHYSRDGRNPGGRVQAAGGGDAVGETIAYGYRDPAVVVQQLIVDDGVPDRGHREIIFAPEFRFAGVGCALHPRYRHACTIDFAATADGRRRPIVYAAR